MTSHYKKIGASLFFIICCVVIRIWGILRIDLASDNAVNAFRAFGWLDDFGGGQLGPIRWLGYIPWWGRLSFQDGPPLVFALEHILFRMFGDATWVALMPSVLSGLLTCGILFFFVQKFRTKESAVVTTIIFCISSYATWAGLAGYLEGTEQLFIMLCFFLIVLFSRNKHSARYLYLGAFFLGLALLSKYTALFLIPTILVILFDTRTFWPEKKYIYATLIFLLTLSPVIIYSGFLIAYRHHPDSALSSMMGIRSYDFGSINGRAVDLASLPWHGLSFFEIFFVTSSFPFACILIISVLWLIGKMIRSKGDVLDQALFPSLVFVYVFFVFLGPSVRFESILMPFLAITAADMLLNIKTIVETKQKYMYILYWIFVSGILGFELFYSINTNILSYPIGAAPFTYSGTRLSNIGFNQLDTYMRSIWKTVPAPHGISSARQFITTDDEIQTASSKYDIILYDNRIQWFASRWYLEKYRIYYRLPIFPLVSRYSADLGDMTLPTNTSVHIIYPLAPDAQDEVKSDSQEYTGVDTFIEYLDNHKYPHITISNEHGVPAFIVYTVTNFSDIQRELQVIN